jgi:ABC-2 type transport system permease protein
MTVVFTMTFLFSSFVENAIGPMIATMSILIVFVIISQLPLDLAQQLKPYLFTNYLIDWNVFFTYDFSWISQLKSIAILGGHSIVLFIITIFIFLKKDILT